MKNDLSALQRAALAIDELRRRLAAAEAALHTAHEASAAAPIAIAGMACRFPGGPAGDADSPTAYWDVLSQGRDGVGEIAPERWRPAADAVPGIRRGGFLRDVARFDARFFDIPPREAAHMDPQHRLLLECAWHALEDAGLAPDRLAGTPVGVYLGLSTSDYAQMLLSQPALSAYYLTGNPLNAAAGRISFTLGLTGPSMVFDTACSSAAVAIHHAAQALRQGDCDLAIAGGANLVLSARGGDVLAAGGQLAADARCKTFDAAADGYVRGEGIGLVVLQRLADRPAGARIRALLLGSATTHDGASSGFTVPSGAAQRRAIEAALRRAGVQPNEVDFVECHGTGTALGDPIEAGALAAAFAPSRGDQAPLVLGAVKTQLGHLESAAASAGLIKAVLALEHEQIPGNLHLTRPNPDIAWDEMALEPARSLRPWPRGTRRRIAGLNSFGASGTNVHLVVAEAPQPSAIAEPARFVPPLLLSAKHPQALSRLAAAYGERLAAGVPFAALAANTALQRAQLPWRVAVHAADAGERLRTLAAGMDLPAKAVSAAVRFAWFFSGQPGHEADAAAWAAALPGWRTALAALPLPAAPASTSAPLHRLRQAVALGYLWQALGAQPSRCSGRRLGLLAAAVFTGAASWDAATAWLAAPAPRAPLALGAAVLAPLLRPDGDPMGEAFTEDDLAEDRTSPGFDAGTDPRADDVAPLAAIHRRQTLALVPLPALAHQIAEAFAAGVRIDAPALLAPASVAWTPLPLYPFGGERHWFEPADAAAQGSAPAAGVQTSTSLPPSRSAVQAPGTTAPDMTALFQRQLDETAAALQTVVHQQLHFLRGQAGTTATPPAATEAATATTMPLFATAAPDTHDLLLLGGTDEAALQAQLAAAAERLATLPAEHWPPYAAEQRAQAAGSRYGAALVADTPQQAAAVLTAAARGDKARRLLRGPRPAQAPRLSFLFSGLGDQYPGMGAELYARLPRVRAAFDRCAAVLQPRLRQDLRAAVFGDAPAADGSVHPLSSTRFAHPALIALQLALAEQWRHWGLAPDDALGYSLGDYAAAAAAGVFAEATVLELVVARAALIEDQAPGAMLAVPLPAERLQPILPPSAYLAAISTPGTSVLAGTPQAIDALAQQLAADKIPARKLQAAHAFHCPLLAPLADALREQVAAARPQPPRLRLVSGCTGRELSPQAAQDPAYWVRHTLEPVRFADGLATLLNEPGRFFLEVGPGLALSSFVFQHPLAERLAGRPVAGSLPNRDDTKHETAFLLETLGRLWLAGFAPDWSAVAGCLAGGPHPS
jgi:acyl transferase domain-containing protein